MSGETLSSDLSITELGNRIRKVFLLTPAEEIIADEAVVRVKQRLLEMPLGPEIGEAEDVPSDTPQ